MKTRLVIVVNIRLIEMVSRERIKPVVEILQKTGRLQKNQLIRKIVEEGFMSHQTASDAIDEAVKSHRIFRQEDYKGKQKIVWLAITSDIDKAEKQLIQELENYLKKFDERFLIFKDKFPGLTLDQKAEGVDLLSYLFRNIVVIAEQLELGFGKTRKWSNFVKELKTRQDDFIKLATVSTGQEAIDIAIHLLSSHIMDVNDAFDDVEEYLKELNK